MKQKDSSQVRNSLTAAFEQVWVDIMTTPVHLDSALSKLIPSAKSILAQTIPKILAQPVSLADELGVGVMRGEPWSLSPRQRADWKPARHIFERLYRQMQDGVPVIKAKLTDYPESMTAQWIKEFGEARALALAEALAVSPPLSLRANGNLTGSDLKKLLDEESVLSCRASQSKLSPKGLVIEKFVKVLQTKAAHDGKFEIQDEGSQAMSYFALWPEEFAGLLTKEPLDRPKKDAPHKLGAVPPYKVVVDACAGAGGKALALADAMHGKARIFAYDISEKKIQALRRRATKANVTNIQARVFDDSILSEFAGTADVVLVDAPCSGWGVLRRNPDIKWRFKEDELSKLPEIQLGLLKKYSGFVKTGGRLVFGVCTFRQSETLDVVEAFSAGHGSMMGFKLGAHGFLGPSTSDGFFMAEWIKE